MQFARARNCKRLPQWVVQAVMLWSWGFGVLCGAQLWPWLAGAGLINDVGYVGV
jgi:hypothetical protein